jgi:hypothetical protein
MTQLTFSFDFLVSTLSQTHEKFVAKDLQATPHIVESATPQWRSAGSESVAKLSFSHSVALLQCADETQRATMMPGITTAAGQGQGKK